MIAPDQIAAIIVCGGASRRFGRDKARAMLEGRSLLERTIECAGARTDEIVLAVGREPRYTEFGLPLALDPAHLEGPVAGIVAGLSASSKRWAFLLAVDLPAVTPAALDRLLAAFVASPEGAIDWVVPRTALGIDPLLSFGVRSVMLDAARALGSGAPAARDLARNLRTLELAVEVTARDPLALALINANHPDDLTAASRRAFDEPPA